MRVPEGLPELPSATSESRFAEHDHSELLFRAYANARRSLNTQYPKAAIKADLNVMQIASVLRDRSNNLGDYNDDVAEHDSIVRASIQAESIVDKALAHLIYDSVE